LESFRKEEGKGNTEHTQDKERSTFGQM
jgi:hypothetical protein